MNICLLYPFDRTEKRRKYVGTYFEIYFFKKQQTYFPHYFKEKHSEIFKHMKHKVKDINNHSEMVVNSGKIVQLRR